MVTETRPDSPSISGQNYRLLINSISDYAIYLLDPTGLVTSWNAGAEKIKGYRAEEIVGRHFSLFYAQSDRDAGEPRRALDIAARDGRFETEAWRVRRDGSRFWASVVVDVVHDEGGALVGFAKITRDITEAKAIRDANAEMRALQRLNELSRRGEARIHQVVESLPNATLMVDSAGRIRMVNAQAEKLFGYRRADLLGGPVDRLVPDRARDRHAGLRAGFFAAPSSRAMGAGAALRARRADGTEIEVEIGLGQVDTEEGTMALAAIVDISERVRLEGRLRQAQKMEVLGRLAAGVSHDFNNILQVILGGVDVLKDEPALSPQARTFLDLIEGAGRRGGYLTHHLLSYVRKQALTPKLIDPAEALERLRLVLSRTLASNIAITLHPRPDAGRVRVDRHQLETALMNLAINAAHAMPNGGTLSLSVSAAAGAPFGEIGPGRHVMIAVEDTGTGMTPEVLERAFDPFFTTKGLDGTGLGLAMVQGFSRQSGGDVRVTSTLGVGTRFEIWLPEDTTAEAEAVAPRPRGGDVPGVAGNVLLVDDVGDVLMMIEASLRQGGFAVRRAGGGREALAALAETVRFDILITDYMMPDMNGVELIRKARCLRPDLPALVISGYADATDVMADLPNATLLTKPFQRHELLERVTGLMAGAPV
jgi:PAS domain S-box-containing protein